MFKKEDFLDEYGEFSEKIEKAKIWNALSNGEKAKLFELKELFIQERGTKLREEQKNRIKDLQNWCSGKNLGISNIPPFN